MPNDKVYLSTSQLAKRYAKSMRTLARWIKHPPSGFPSPTTINGRHLWPQDAIEEFERSCAAELKKAA